jgi:hypothetical protein
MIASIPLPLGVLLWFAASFIALFILNLVGWFNRRRFPNP